VLAALNALVSVYIYTLLPEFLIRFMIWILANLIYRLKVLGTEKVPTEGPAVLVCNHVSFVDWMVIAAGVKRPVRFIMDHSYAQGFVTRLLCKQAKVILIAPASENPAVLRASFETISQALREGELVCIFPEGRLTPDGKLHSFKTGVEKIIRDTPVPVIPMALRGLWGSFFSRKGGRAILKRPTRFWSRVELVIAAPIPPETASAAHLQEKVAELLR
jgi:1-acyl-sn-glycerol-3-phosphate acyltransferase